MAAAMSSGVSLGAMRTNECPTACLCHQAWGRTDLTESRIQKTRDHPANGSGEETGSRARLVPPPSSAAQP
jgi:hypothetical protein